MNREAKRMAKRMGQTVNDQGQVLATPTPRTPMKRGKRVGPVQFAREVMVEMRKVLWPPRRSVVSYAFVTITALVVVGFFIWVIDNIFVLAVRNLYK